MFRLASCAKEFTFHAAHRDESAPPGDQCGRLHGHTYKLRLEVVTMKLDDRGMVIHGDLLKKFYREELEPAFEHQYLNETLDFNPTMEAVTEFVLDLFYKWVGGQAHRVTVCLWETPTMYCEMYR